MKNLAITTAAVAFVLAPAASHANIFWQDSDSNKDAQYKTERSHQEHVNIRDQDSSDMRVFINKTESATGAERAPINASFQAKNNGENVQIRNDKIYLVQADGYKHFAPNGPYTAPQGVTFIAEDGLVVRTEQPDEVAYLDVDYRDQDRDGYSDDVRVRTETQIVR